MRRETFKNVPDGKRFGSEVQKTGIVQRKIKDAKKKTRQKRREIFQNATQSAAVTRVLQDAVDLSRCRWEGSSSRDEFVFHLLIHLFISAATCCRRQDFSFFFLVRQEAES